MMSVQQLLSKTAVPPSPMSDPQEFRTWLEWMEKQRSSKINEPWVDTIRYDLNEFGYRCDEFDNLDGTKLFSIGCSFTFGTALPYEFTYSYQVARMLENELGRPTVNWNLSCPAKSADYVARVVSSAVPHLMPDLAIINFPLIARREFITEKSKILGYTPNLPERIVRDVLRPEAYDVYNAYSQLSSLANDIRNLILNYRLCEAVLERCGVIWCYSTRHENDSTYIADLEGNKNHIGEFLATDRKAADGAHSGPVAHEAFAEAIMRHLMTSGKMDTLKADKNASR